MIIGVLMLLVTLFARAVLCNWLVCLAIWMAART